MVESCKLYDIINVRIFFAQLAYYFKNTTNLFFLRTRYTITGQYVTISTRISMAKRHLRCSGERPRPGTIMPPFHGCSVTWLMRKVPMISGSKKFQTCWKHGSRRGELTALAPLFCISAEGNHSNASCIAKHLVSCECAACTRVLAFYLSLVFHAAIP